MAIDRKKLAEVMRAAAEANQSAGIAVVTGAVIAAGLTYLADDLDELEKRVDEQPFRYDGPHEGGKTYQRGLFVTHAGSLWHANYTTAILAKRMILPHRALLFVLSSPRQIHFDFRRIDLRR